MIKIHSLVFVTLLELLVVFAALWLVWFFKVRTLNRRLAELRMTKSAPLAGAGDGAYFTEELVATRAQIDAEVAADPAVSQAPLALRAAYLELERVFAQGQRRDAAFWERAREQLGELLDAQVPATPDAIAHDNVTTSDATDESPVAPAEDNDENNEPIPEGKTQLPAQAAVLDEFKNALGALLADQQHNPDMLIHADKLMRCSRELAMCMAILDEDNKFLREKLIAAGLLEE